MTYGNGVFKRAIHNIENSYFRSKFEPSCPIFQATRVSASSATPTLNHHHQLSPGKFAIVTVAKINNVEELEKELLASGNHFSEHSNNIINQSELVSMIISQGKDYVEGIRLVQEKIKGSCSMLLLTEQGIIAARDKYRPYPHPDRPAEENGYAVSSETSQFPPTLGYELCYNIGPGEIVRLTADGYETLDPARQEDADMLVPVGILTAIRPVNTRGRTSRRCASTPVSRWAKANDIEADFVSGIPATRV